MSRAFGEAYTVLPCIVCILLWPATCVVYHLQFGTSEFSAMPEFISIPLEDVIYKLLANTQLSIRENAIKCYSAYLGRCELKVRRAMHSVLAH